MSRPILSPDRLHPAIRERVATLHQDVLTEVITAVERDDVVVVGMRQNPHPKQARKALDRAGIAHTYLEYGSYLSAWRRRTALKMWTGWPTFPMVFVKGTLVGGASDLIKLIEDGALRAMLDSAGD